MAKKKSNSFLNFLGMCINLGVGVVAIICIFLPVFTITIFSVTSSIGMFDDGVNFAYIISYLLIALAGLAGAGLLFKKQSGFIPSLTLAIVCLVGVVLIYVIDPVDFVGGVTIGAGEANGFGPILLTIAGIVGAGVNGFLAFCNK